MRYPSAADALDVAIDAAIADRRIVGAVVLVAREGEVVYRRATGLADREAAVPLRDDAIFRLASVTKPFVTAAAMRLCHAAFFGTGAVVAAKLAPEGREARAIALMISGLTLANVLGVPLGTLIGHAQDGGRRS